ncbi:MAG TPA: hypothetical protein VFG14_16510, partial [Chthoniobacteraceae bacterium]|nr:hypothetical protein [Chthoniobacteraceae bacterium]
SDIGWVAISAGHKHSLALKGDRSLWAWGINDLAQLGRGHDDRILTPVQIDSASNWNTISTQIVSNLATRTDGTMWAWGAAYPYGTLTPVQVGQPHHWQATAAGREHNLALTSGGEIFSWGDGEQGQLGHGSTGEMLLPTHIEAGNNWRQIAAGNWHSAGVKSDDSLWVWGGNDHAQLGDGTLEIKTIPIQVGANDWRTIAPGAYHNLALKIDGSLWGWGYNLFHQLTSAAAEEFQTSVMQIGTEKDWWRIAGGGYHSLALKTNRTLWYWGANHFGPVLPGTDPPLPPTPVPTQIGTDSNWQMIAAGRWHSLAIKEEGSLWAWGRNLDGQLGIGSLENQAAPVRVGTGNDWNAIAAGPDHSIALKTDGTLWGWGSNVAGQIGLDLMMPISGGQIWGPME